MDRVQLIRDKLTATLEPASLEIRDDSLLHAGHEGAKSGGGHFTIDIVSHRFTGQTLVNRHRMIYEALGAAMPNEIHALSITARAPDEA